MDIDVANQRGVEQQLWRTVYYNIIEGLRHHPHHHQQQLQQPQGSEPTASNKQALEEVLDEVSLADKRRYIYEN
jgi:hypothetical protein